MPIFEHQHTVAHPREDVFAWHGRPGALTRLMPAHACEVVQEPTDGVRDGSTSRMRVAVPGSQGLVRLDWLARHQGYRPPEQFEDVMVSGPMNSWHHVHEFREAEGGGTTVADRITYELPVVRGGAPEQLAGRVGAGQLERIWAYRDRQLEGDLAFHATHDEPRLTIAVTGSTGMLGTQLVALLSSGGHTVRRVRRGEAGPGEILWDPQGGDLDPEDLRDVDVVVHLAGESLIGRMGAARKERIMQSRRRGTALVADALASLADDGRPRALVSASAAGWYGPEPGDEVLTEDMGPGEGFLAAVCQEWEDACESARRAGVRVVNVRTGIVQSLAGGQLALQAPLFRAGLGGPLGTGKQWMPWIALDDIVGLVAHAALTDGLEGPVNGVAPGIVRNEEYAHTLGGVLHRPSLVRVPRIGPSLLLGSEGADEIALAGQRMSADRALEWGYRFRFPHLVQALQHAMTLAP